MSKKAIPLDIEAIKRAYQDDRRSLQSIGDDYGVSAVMIRNRLYQAGISSRGGIEVCTTTKAKIKEDLVCCGCGANWKNEHVRTYTYCPHCGKRKDARDRREEAGRYEQALERKKKLVEWYSDPENRKAKGAQYRILLRKRVFFRICGSIHPTCVRCGCDDPRLLEVNHKNGGGAREVQWGKLTNKFYCDIASGKRPTDDLELLCKPCNAIHYLEMKFGPLPMSVVWDPQLKS